MTFFTDLSELGRSTQVVKADSWHAKMYAFWQNHGLVKNQNYRENLCHYCRVVTIWGPLSWFVFGNLFSRKVRPYVAVTTLLYFVMCAIVAFGFRNGPLTASVMLVPPLLIAGMYRYERSSPGKLYAGAKYAANKVDPYVTWYFSKKLFSFVTPALMVLAAIIAWFLWVNPQYIISVAYTATFWGFWVIVFILARRSEKRKKIVRDLERKVANLEADNRRLKAGQELDALRDRLIRHAITSEEYHLLHSELIESMFPTPTVVTRAPAKIRQPRTGPIAEAFRLGVRFIAAKKHKICPFIEFEVQRSQAA